MGSYLWFMAALLICGIFSALASAKVHRTYAKYGKISSRSGMTGYDTAYRLLRAGESLGMVRLFSCLPRPLLRRYLHHFSARR